MKISPAIPLASLLLLSFFAGCNSLDSDTESDAVYLRITNVSSIDFSSVYVSFPGAESTFGSLQSGETSSYRELDTAYRYGYIEVESNNEKYVLQPIDFVGEQPLENGCYTFQLDIAGENVALQIVKES